MSQVIQFAILGLAAGALYVLIALGLVIIHRGSGVVNFAQGAIGMVGTYVFWDLNQNHGLPYGVAVVVGVAVSALIGVLTHVLIMRPLASAAPVTRMIATLGLLTVLEQAAARYWPTTTISVPSKLPTDPVKILGASVGRNQLIIIGIVLVVAALLMVLYHATQFGRITAATSENRRALALLGVSPDKVAAANWAIGGALAGGAGVLLAPITGLDVTQFTLLVLPALAGAVVGRLNSFPLTIVGGLVIGVAQSEMSRYIHQPGWSESAPFLIIVVVLVLRGRDKTLRSSLGERLPRLGSGRVRVRSVLPAFAIGVVAIELMSRSWVDSVTTLLIAAILLLSLVVVTGYSGQLSLAQFAFAGWGAWVAGRLVATTGMPFLAALVIGVLASLPLALLLGVVCLRVTGTNLAIATLAFAVALEQILFDSTDYTGGVNGTNIGFPHVFGIDVDAIMHTSDYSLMCLVFLTLCGLVVANLRRGRSGRRLIAVRGNERAAASLGINVVGARLYAFCLAGMIASLGGILLAFRNPAILYNTFDSMTSIQLVSQAVVGGIGWIAGTLFGGLLQDGSPGTQVLNLFGDGVGTYLALIGGALLLLTLIAAPDGIAYQNWLQVQRLKAWLEHRVGRSKTPRRAPHPLAQEQASAQQASAEPFTVPPATLAVEGLGVRYGGVIALADVDLIVRPGEIVGLIGPNGAGKTTLIDAVTGFVRPMGRVLLDGRDVTGQSATKLSRAGLGRSFQSLELFDDMSVLDNLRVASDPRDRVSYLADLIYPRTPALSPAVLATIREFDLGDDLDKAPSSLPYGRRRQVGIGRAVATTPSVLLLDEPAAGLDDHESRELGSLIRDLARTWGMGILLVEHDVELVMSVCDRVYALNFGRCIAEGTPAEIRSHPEVIAAYLGEPAEAPAADVTTAQVTAGDER